MNDEIDVEFQTWFSEHKHTLWTNPNINRFIFMFHRFLKLHDMCFLSGAYVFEDPHGILFNLYTYNMFEKQHHMATRGHTDQSQHFEANDKSSLVNPVVTGTHKVFIDKQNLIPSIYTKHKLQPTYAKYDRLFTKDFRAQPVNYLCDSCIPTDDVSPLNAEPKRVILYYPFSTKKNNIQMLYVKFESYPSDAIEHATEFITSAATSRQNTYAKRRENEKTPGPNQKLMDDDLFFYVNNFPEDIPSLEFYNQNVRAKDEFFVGWYFLRYALMKFLTKTSIQMCNLPVEKRVIHKPESQLQEEAEEDEELADLITTLKLSPPKENKVQIVVPPPSPSQVVAPIIPIPTPRKRKTFGERFDTLLFGDDNKGGSTRKFNRRSNRKSNRKFSRKSGRKLSRKNKH
jgi:hypothetical protein